MAVYLTQSTTAAKGCSPCAIDHDATPHTRKSAFRRINATLGEKSRRWVVLDVRPIGGSFVSGSSCRIKPIFSRMRARHTRRAARSILDVCEEPPVRCVTQLSPHKNLFSPTPHQPKIGRKEPSMAATAKGCLSAAIYHGAIPHQPQNWNLTQIFAIYA